MIEDCRDFRRVKKFLSREIDISRENFYLMEVQNGEDLGVWHLHPCLDGVCIHADLGDKCRGKDAVASARDVFEWIFQNTHNKIIYAAIPEEVRTACMVATWAGMTYQVTEQNCRLYSIEKITETDQQVRA